MRSLWLPSHLCCVTTQIYFITQFSVTSQTTATKTFPFELNSIYYITITENLHYKAYNLQRCSEIDL